jgi:predicted RNA-binding protein with PUA-like domain
MRQMKIGDLGFSYHSQSEKYVVGVASIIAESRQESTTDDQLYDCVDVVTVEPLAKPIIINCGSATDCYLDRQHHVRRHAAFVFQVFHVLSH